MQTPMIKEISNYFGVKLLEWMASLTLTSFGLELLITNHPTLGGMIFFIGAIRLIALIVNGRSWEYGPKARAVCAVIGSLVWIQTGCALIFALPIGSHSPSPAIPMCVWLTLAELVTAYRAATDVRIRSITGSSNN